MAKRVKKLLTVSVKKPKKTIYSTPLPEAREPATSAHPGWVSGVLLGACLVILIVVGIATS